MAAVPNTNTFNLQNVANSIGGGITSLAGAFSAANPAYFDPLYSGAKDQLLNFRNYGYKTTDSFSLANSGYIVYSDADWSACRTAGSGTLVQDSHYYIGSDYASSLYYIWRTFWRFNLSSITGGATCLSATLSAGFNTDNSITMSLIKGTQADTLTGADFDNFDTGVTIFSSKANISQPSCTPNYYFKWTATSAERSTIAGFFSSSLKIAVLEYHDIANSEPASQYRSDLFAAGECVSGCVCTPVLTIEHTL